MDHALRVGRLQRRGDLPRDAQHIPEPQRTAIQPVREILTGDQLHRDEVPAVLLVETVDRCNVRVVDRGEQFRLALEAREPALVGRNFRIEHLDRHLAVEAGVAGLPDLAHPTLADLLDQPVVRK